MKGTNDLLFFINGAYRQSRKYKVRRGNYIEFTEEPTPHGFIIEKT